MQRNSMTVMCRLLKLVKPLRGTMVLAVAMGVLGHLCAIFVTVAGAIVITGGSWQMALIILPLIALLRGVFHLLEQNRNHYLAFKLLALIRDEVFGALRKLAPAKLEGRDKGNLIAILTADIELLEVFYAHTISPVFIALIVSLIMIVYIGSFHIVLGLIAFVSYIVIGIVVPLTASKMSQKYGDAFVLDSLRGLKESIQYGSGKERLQEIQTYSSSLLEKEKKLKGAAGTSAAVTSGMILVFDILMLFASAFLFEKGLIDARGAVISVIALMSSFGPVIALASLGTGIQNTLAAGNRVLDILDEVPVVKEVSDGKNIQYAGAECKNVCFAYDQEEILNDFSMDIPEKGIIGIVGKSGSGKSTMLKAIAGIFSPDEGSIDLHGNSVSLLSIGVGFQKKLTGRENILLSGLLLGFSEEQVRAKMDEIINFAGLGKFIDMPVKTYSSGMYSKLAFSITAILEADIMLIDEVLSVGDAKFKKKSYNKMKELISNEDRTVVIVSHSSQQLQELCTSILWLHEGELRMQGETKEVLEAYEEFMS